MYKVKYYPPVDSYFGITSKYRESLNLDHKLSGDKSSIEIYGKVKKKSQG